ncbi:MAG TPA: ATP synthase F1 subunit gamma [Candidatus Kaiserbacteria bacterium]|nr:ATP synthase F1 subunit gamma [Candidatus Kaiserbacteria bacterium]
MALKDIKSKIQATERTHKVTRAMQAVSAVKMRKTQQTALEGRPYAHAALSILARLSGSRALSAHPLTQARDVKRVALVIITSDKGLAGSVNSSVIKSAVEALAESLPREEVAVYAFGKKGEEYFARRGYNIVMSFENKRDDVPRSVVKRFTKDLTESFVEGKYDEVLVAYSRFCSTFEQVPTVHRLLPLSLESIKFLVEDIVPGKGKWSDLSPLSSPPHYVVEAKYTNVLDSLIPRLVSTSLYHLLLESKASEHSARMVAMKNASDKSKEVTSDLTRRYNKARQSVITREVSEIVGGREALAS